MYPDPFEYRSASTVDEAIDLLTSADGEVELMAGGHSLLPTMKSGLAAPDLVVDITGIDRLTGVETDDGVVRIGALTRYADIVADDAIEDGATHVAEAAGEIGDIQVRNMGTIGGNLAHADPASDLPAAVLAADATVHAQGPDGSRTIPADEFFTGTFMTSLDHDELLTAVDVPVSGPNAGSAYVKKPNPASGYAMIGVAAAVETDGGTISDARVAATGALDHADRLRPVEEALVGERPDDADAIEAAADRATDDVEEFRLLEDVRMSAEFRGHLLTVYTERAVTTAAERAVE